VSPLLICPPSTSNSAAAIEYNPTVGILLAQAVPFTEADIDPVGLLLLLFLQLVAASKSADETTRRTIARLQGNFIVNEEFLMFRIGYSTGF
jgi:hypothetical protein